MAGSPTTGPSGVVTYATAVPAPISMQPAGGQQRAWVHIDSTPGACEGVATRALQACARC